MAKPICVVYYLPEALSPPNGRLLSVFDVNETIKTMLPDYHTLAIPSKMSIDGSCEDLRLEVFYEKDFTEIKFEELKKIIEDAFINQNK